MVGWFVFDRPRTGHSAGKPCSTDRVSGPIPRRLFARPPSGACSRKRDFAFRCTFRAHTPARWTSRPHQNVHPQAAFYSCNIFRPPIFPAPPCILPWFAWTRTTCPWTRFPSPTAAVVLWAALVGSDYWAKSCPTVRMIPILPSDDPTAEIRS